MEVNMKSTVKSFLALFLLAIPFVSYGSQDAGETLSANQVTYSQEELNELLLQSVDSWEKTKILIEKGADVSYRGKNGWTALFFAVWAGYLETVNVLIATGADVNMRGHNAPYQTALMIAIRGWNRRSEQQRRGDREKIVDRLIELGVDVNMVPEHGETALMVAVKSGAYTIAKKLIKAGAFTRLKDIYGQDALLIAIAEGDEQMVKLLLDHVFSKQIPTAMSLAEEKGYTNIVDLLEEKKREIEKKRREGWNQPVPVPRTTF